MTEQSEHTLTATVLSVMDVDLAASEMGREEAGALKQGMIQEPRIGKTSLP